MGLFGRAFRGVRLGEKRGSGPVGHARDRRADRTVAGVKNCLKVLRAELGWSQQELAERVAVSRQSINAVETGRYDPSLPLAFRIASVFGLAIEDIFLRD